MNNWTYDNHRHQAAEQEQKARRQQVARDLERESNAPRRRRRR